MYEQIRPCKANGTVVRMRLLPKNNQRNEGRKVTLNIGDFMYA